MNNKVLEADIQAIEQEIITEEEILLRRQERKEEFLPLTIEELIETLGLTIKEDNTNKVITFLCCLSAYTEDSQFNLSFNAPSSSGKSYIPIEISLIFPDVIKVGYCSPTAFFHDKGSYNKEQEGYFMNLERKILIFLDQPHTQLLEHLRPLLSHDEKEIRIKITDKSQKYGLKTKNMVIKGYPSVIFCSAGLKIDEQEATRFLLLSPETTQEKLRQGVIEALKKATNSASYLASLNANPQRELLKARIKAIKEEQIEDIRIHNPNMLQELFLSQYRVLKPRHQRDIKRLSSIIKSLALLNLWHRQSDGLRVILTSEEDIKQGFSIWSEISYSQELNLPPYIYKFFEEVIIPTYEEKRAGLTRNEVLRGHLRIYGRPLEEWKLRREIIPMLEMSGLITQEQDPDDRRNRLILPILPHH